MSETNTTPKISVIIPIFNKEDYLHQAIDSLRNQTIKELEIICVDDGSTDTSLEILKKYEAIDSRIRIISRENKGVGISRNDGIAAAKGEFIAFLDPDDYIPENDIYEELYSKAKKNNVLIAGGSLGHKLPDKENLIASNGKYSKHKFEKEGVIRFRDYQWDYGFYRFIYNRKLIIDNKIIFPPYVRFQDPIFMLKAMVKAETFYAIPRFTYAFRREHKVMTWNQTKIRDLFAGLKDVWDVACRYKLDTLKQHIREHTEDHFKMVKDMLGPEQWKLINEIDEDLRKKSMTARKFCFSKHKNFLDPNRRKRTIFGFTYSYKHK